MFDNTKSNKYCLRVGSFTSCFKPASLQIFHKRSPTAVLECEWWSHRWWCMLTSPTRRIPITSPCNLLIAAASPSRELPSSSGGLYQFPNRIVPKFVSKAHHIRYAPSSYSSRAMFVKEDLANMAMPPNPHFGPSNRSKRPTRLNPEIVTDSTSVDNHVSCNSKISTPAFHKRASSSARLRKSFLQFTLQIRILAQKTQLVGSVS